MKRLLIFLIPVLWGFLPVFSQMTLVVDTLPRYFTPFEDTLYVAGDFNNWNPADPQYALTDNGNGTWSIVLNGNNGTPMEYKFTRGSWPRVETQANGAFLPNRTLTFQNGATQNHTVLNWEDTAGPHSTVGNTYWLDVNFYMPQVNRTRRIWIYLPPDYFTSSASYPVLYMHDGQNLFDKWTSFSGEWEVDESMEQLIAGGYTAAIVVGIDNGGSARVDEYSPWVNATYGGGQGADYVDFIINILKPYIDIYYRSKPGRDHTAIMGSSLGGQISHYAAVSRQDVFSKAGLLSPSYWFANEAYTLVSQTGKQYPMRFFLLAGGQESPIMVPNMNQMANTFTAVGFDSTEVKAVVKSDGEHSEWFWAREFPAAYRWLFRPAATGMEAEDPVSLALYPNPATEMVFVADPEAEGKFYSILDATGHEVGNGRVELGRIPIDSLPGGMYFLEIRHAKKPAFGRFLKVDRE